MTLHGVDKGFWATNLVPILDDKSLKFQSNLPLEEKEDFDMLSARLIDIQGVTSSMCRIEWKI